MRSSRGPDACTCSVRRSLPRSDTSQHAIKSHHYDYTPPHITRPQVHPDVCVCCSHGSASLVSVSPVCMGVVGVALLALLAYACVGSQQRSAIVRAARALLSYLTLAYHAAMAPGVSGAAKVTGRVTVSRVLAQRRDSPPGVSEHAAAPGLHTSVATWTCGDVAAWLHSIELGAYADSFTSHSVCGLLLLSLTRDELATLGMVSPLHVKKLQLRLAAREGGEQLPAVAVASAASALPQQLLPRREALLMEAGSATDAPRSEAATDIASLAPSEADSSCCGLLRGHGGWVTACAWCPDGTLLTGGDDGAVRVWDRPDAALSPPVPICTLEGHAGAVRALALLRSHGGSSELRCGTVGDDGTLRLWVITPSAEPPVRCEAVVAAHSDAVFGLLALPSGEELVTCSADATARMWAVGREGAVTPGPVLQGHSDYVLAACHLAQGDDVAQASVQAGAPRLLVTAGLDATLRVWELPPVSEAHAPPLCARILRGHRGGVRCVVALPRWRCCSAGADGTLRLWQAATGAAERVLRLPRGPTPASPGAVLALAALPGGTGVGCAREDGIVRLWGVTPGPDAGLKHSLEGHAKRVYCLAVRPGGLTHSEVVLASGSRDRTVRLWRAPPSWL